MDSATVITAEHGGEDAGLSSLHPDIIKSHVLTRLNGPDLASAASSSATLRRLSSDDSLWSDICHATWPSTASPQLQQVISAFPGGGPRAFFSDAFALPNTYHRNPIRSTPPPSELISAVDIRYKDKPIFTKVQETETVTGWFLCSPFRIDMLEPKDAVPTPMQHPEGDDACMDIFNDMILSWVLIDPAGRRAASLSSHKPVAVQRHWLTGEVHVRYATILAAGDKGYVQCMVVVTCGGSEQGDMQVKEVSMEMEDMDGMHLTGKDSLVILHGGLEGKKGSGGNRVEEGQKRYREFVEMKRERRERKVRTEGVLDRLCVVFGVSVLVAFCSFILFR